MIDYKRTKLKMIEYKRTKLCEGKNGEKWSIDIDEFFSFISDHPKRGFENFLLLLSNESIIFWVSSYKFCLYSDDY